MDLLLVFKDELTAIFRLYKLSIKIRNINYFAKLHFIMTSIQINANF